MPNYTKEIKEARAKILAKTCIEKRLNQSAIAREQGVSHQAINEQIHRPAVRSALQEALRKVGISTKYKAKKFKELLESKRPIACDMFIKNKKGKLTVVKNENDWIEVEDNTARVATLRLLCQVEGDIKDNGNGKGVNATILIRIGDSNKLLTPSETEHISHQRK